MSIDSNSVTITCPDILNIEYIDGSDHVTEGEDNKTPPAIEQSGSTWTITFLADRQNSTPVAQSFYSDTGGKSGATSHAWSADAVSDPMPSQLNFYFAVTLTMATTGPNPVSQTIYLGQGNTGFPAYDNNWWIGGEYVTSYGQQTFSATLTVLGSTYSIIGSTSSFKLVSDSC